MLESNLLIQNILSINRDYPKKIFAKLLFSSGYKNISYEDLIKNAGRYANFFKAKGLGQNQVIVLILKHSPELIYSFVGAMLYGAIPSIFAFPSLKMPAYYYRKTLPPLLKNCQTKFVLAYSQLADELDGLEEYVEILAEKDYLAYPQAFAPFSLPEPSQIAFLQHSSGTTGLKKGIALSNQAVVNQIRNYASSISLKKEDKIVSWLPLYHDMGLIACFILPLVCGIPLVMMSPFDWVQNPVMLPEAIHRERASLCWLPNFAYNFLASRIPEKKLNGLCLSSMRAFINCAEPISAKSHELFYQRFKKYGLSKKALCTCYAMAENTFAVTQGGIKEPVYSEEIDWKVFSREKKAVLAKEKTEKKRELVSSGQAISNNHIRIVDEKGKDLPERCAGEIVIKSDSVLSGYYNRPDLTKKAIIEGWYFTGDIGYLAGKELFVTGRKKDIFIVAGKNIYPQDIEELVSSIKGIYPGRVVTFGLYSQDAGTEELIILAETGMEAKAEKLKVKLAIAQAVKENFECAANEIHLLPHMWLLKSSSGKISRPGNREKYKKEIRKYVIE